MTVKWHNKQWFPHIKKISSKLAKKDQFETMAKLENATITIVYCFIDTSTQHPKKASIPTRTTITTGM